MNKEIYERMSLEITEFDTEDIIITSGEEPVNPPAYYDDPNESTAGFPTVPGGI